MLRDCGTGGCSFRWLGFDPDSSAITLNHALANSQPGAGVSPVTMETLENAKDFLLVPGIDADAFILHGKEPGCAQVDRREVNSRRLVWRTKTEEPTFKCTRVATLHLAAACSRQHGWLILSRLRGVNNETLVRRTVLGFNAVGGGHFHSARSGSGHQGGRRHSEKPKELVSQAELFFLPPASFAGACVSIRARARHPGRRAGGARRRSRRLWLLLQIRTRSGILAHHRSGLADGYGLIAANSVRVRPSLVMAVYARLIAARQEADGHWETTDERPPQSYSPFTATAVSLRAIQLYAHPSQKADIQARADMRRSWLLSHQPRATEERVYQLLGASWAGADTGHAPEAGRRTQSHPAGRWGLEFARRPIPATLIPPARF